MPDLPTRSSLRVKSVANGEKGWPWQRDLLLLGIALGLLWAWDTVWVWPLKVLVVLFHETGHALATVATGGEVIQLTVSANESGAVYSAGGWPFVTLNAGYLGSLAWGLVLMYGSKRPRGAQLVSAGLGILFLWIAAFWARPLFSFGFVATLGAATLFGALARWGGYGLAAVVLRIIGIFSVLYALGDVVDDVLMRPGAPSDARFLYERSGIPAIVWGLGWSAISLTMLRVLGPRLR